MTVLDLLLLPIRLPFWLLVKWIEWSLRSETFERVKLAYFLTLMGLGLVMALSAPTTKAQQPVHVQRDDNRSGSFAPPQALQGNSFPGGAVLHDSNGNHFTCQELPGFQNWVRCFGDR